MSRGEKYNQAGLQSYQDWELEKAVAAFKKAAAAEPDNAEYHLNLARALARSSNFHEAIQALGEYLRTETDPTLSSRYERLFSSALDEVESALIEGMRQLGLSIRNYTGVPKTRTLVNREKKPFPNAGKCLSLSPWT